jgi:hypothetical protein
VTPGKIGRIVLYSFPYAPESQMRSIAVSPRGEKAKLFQNQLFCLSVVQDHEAFGRDRLSSEAHFVILFNPTKDHVRDEFHELGLAEHERSKTNPYHSIPNLNLFEKSVRKGL